MDLALVVCSTLIVVGLVGSYLWFPRRSLFFSSCDFPGLDVLEQLGKKKLRKELNKFVPNKEGLKILYDWRYGQIVSANEYPSVYDCLQKVGGVIRIFVAKIARTKTSVNRCAQDDEDFVRGLFPIVAPPVNSDIYVEKQMRIFKEKQWVLFDDTQKSEISNEDNNQSLFILGVDLEKPHWYPEAKKQDDKTWKSFFHTWSVDFDHK
jgi:hypothetical protein